MTQHLPQTRLANLHPCTTGSYACAPCTLSGGKGIAQTVAQFVPTGNEKPRLTACRGLLSDWHCVVREYSSKLWVHCSNLPPCLCQSAVQNRSFSSHNSGIALSRAIFDPYLCQKHNTNSIETISFALDDSGEAQRKKALRVRSDGCKPPQPTSSSPETALKALVLLGFW